MLTWHAMQQLEEEPSLDWKVFDERDSLDSKRAQEGQPLSVFCAHSISSKSVMSGPKTPGNNGFRIHSPVTLIRKHLLNYPLPGTHESTCCQPLLCWSACPERGHHTACHRSPARHLRLITMVTMRRRLSWPSDLPILSHALLCPVSLSASHTISSVDIRAAAQSGFPHTSFVLLFYKHDPTSCPRG